MKKPIIGLTTYPAGATHGWHTPALYVDAVLRAGGVPMMLSGQCPDLPSVGWMWWTVWC